MQNNKEERAYSVPSKKRQLGTSRPSTAFPKNPKPIPPKNPKPTIPPKDPK